jgi:hypothetical protein
MSEFAIDVRKSATKGICTVVSINANGDLLCRDQRVERVSYIRGSSVGEVEATVRRQLGCAFRCTEMANDAGWFAVQYDLAQPALLAADFEQVVEQTRSAPLALWLTRWLGAAAPRMPPLRCVAVAVCERRAVLLPIGTDEAPTTVEADSERQLVDEVAAALLRLRAHVVVSRTRFAGVDCAHIDIVAALHWMSVIPNKAISSYALCRAAGAELLPVVLRDERAAEIEADAIKRLFAEHSVLNVALELSRRTGVALGRMFSVPRSELVESMLLTQAVKCKNVPLVKSVAPPPPASDGTRGGLYLPAVCGAHSDGPFAMLDFSATYPSLIVEHGLCWHDGSPLLPALMQELLRARRDAPDAGHKLAVKLLANSVAGCLWTTSGGQFSAAAVGDQVAALGRTLLERTAAAADQLGLTVLYGATDSLLVRCGASDAAEAQLVERASTAHVTLREQARFDQVAIFNKKDMLGLAGGQVSRCAGLYEWTQSEWLRQHVPLAIKAVLVDGHAVDEVVDAALAELSHDAEWCARELVYFGAGDIVQTEPLIGNNVRARDFCAAARCDVDSVRTWYRDQLRRQVCMRVERQQQQQPAPARASTMNIRFGQLPQISAAAAMPEARKLIDIEDLAGSPLPLPLCVRRAVAERYTSGQHKEQQLPTYLACRAAGLSQTDTQAYMLHAVPPNKQVERARTVRDFERAAATKWQQSVDGYIAAGAAEDDAKARASCFANCKTLARSGRCPFAADDRQQALREAGASEDVIVALANTHQSATAGCAAELLLTFRANAPSIEHMRDYVAAAKERPAASEPAKRKRA